MTNEQLDEIRVFAASGPTDSAWIKCAKQYLFAMADEIERANDEAADRRYENSTRD